MPKKDYKFIFWETDGTRNMSISISAAVPATAIKRFEKLIKKNYPDKIIEYEVYGQCLHMGKLHT